MVKDMHRLLVGNALSASSRRRLTAWLIANTTGDTRLRAGLPKGWRVGDKTGTGDHRTQNDVAIVWRPGGHPILLRPTSQSHLSTRRRAMRYCPTSRESP
jgi:beta-lactamase class A